jgi:hypothetical protein
MHKLGFEISKYAGHLQELQISLKIAHLPAASSYNLFNRKRYLEFSEWAIYMQKYYSIGVRRMLVIQVNILLKNL